MEENLAGYMCEELKIRVESVKENEEGVEESFSLYPGYLVSDLEIKRLISKFFEGREYNVEECASGTALFVEGEDLLIASFYNLNYEIQIEVVQAPDGF